MWVEFFTSSNFFEIRTFASMLLSFAILIKEELNKFDQKRKCVNCKKPGGTLFEITKKTLKCICNADKKCNLHIENLYGKNNHHIIESCFKAFAKSLRFAVEIDNRRKDNIPSSKGTL